MHVVGYCLHYRQTYSDREDICPLLYIWILRLNFLPSESSTPHISGILYVGTRWHSRWEDELELVGLKLRIMHLNLAEDVVEDEL